MKQKRAKSLAQLIAAGTDARAGAAKHAVALGLHVGTVAAIEADLLPLLAFRDSHSVANAELAQLRLTLRRATKELYQTLFQARDFLKRTFGNQYSSRWEGTGFQRSLRIPRTFVQLQHVTGILAACLEANPALEVPNVLTAVTLRTVLEAAQAARKAVVLQKSATDAELAKRRGKEKALRKRLSWMVDELHRVLDPLDGRWLAFGFNQPGVKQKPPTPEPVSVTPLGDETAVVEWPKAPRAEYYRVWVREKREDAEFKAIATPRDPRMTISLTSVEREVAVSAVNNGGESGLSEVKSLPAKKEATGSEEVLQDPSGKDSTSS